MTSQRLTVAAGALILMLAALSLAVFQARAGEPAERRDPRERLPKPLPHLDHSAFFQQPFADGPAVTRACLECHQSAAREVMATSHWTWLGPETVLPGRTEPVRIGKRNSINNYCIGIQSNWPACTSCHAGYGWRDAGFDFSDQHQVDCLICHDRTGSYRKQPGGAGLTAPEVDLLTVARQVGRPGRQNCGYCHFAGGGGDAVKHGDLDGSMYHPTARIDFHMGDHMNAPDFACQDCHRTRRHAIAGASMTFGSAAEERIGCGDCHGEAPHHSDRLNAHTARVACQSCHIPRMAVDTPTKLAWDWSEAGQDRPEDPHHYLKIKGAFTYGRNVIPEYYWFNGQGDHYLPGDPIDPQEVTALNRPLGEREDSSAKLYPFKVHRGKQLYDSQHRYLLVPKTYGEGGYWTEFDWDRAARLGAEATGLAYSGQYGFADTEMYWVLTHMVAPRDKSLQCLDCHGKQGRLDWERLGYAGDPAWRSPAFLARLYPGKTAEEQE